MRVRARSDAGRYNVHDYKDAGNLQCKRRRKCCAPRSRDLGRYAKHEEKFNSVQVQFAERDTRTEQTSKDSKVAVDAALQAAKEAVGEQNKSSTLAIAKSEAATTKQIDQISVIINTMAKGLDDKIDDIKTRLTSIEGRAKGLGDGWGYLVGAIGTLIAIAGVIMMFVKH
jgi:hypothetical protein